MKKQDVSMLKYGMVFAVTLMVFVFGLLLGNYLTEQKLESVRNIEENVRIQTAGAELQYLLLIQDPCEYVNNTPLTEELYEISEKVDFMEGQRGEKDLDVRRLKNTYSLLQIRHWLFTKQTSAECNILQVPVLYFYSNEGDCPSCREQGYTLTYLRKEHPSILVYAFDINTENPALDTLKRIYDVESVPTLILPESKHEFMTLEDLQITLSSEYNLTLA